jgi:hypothetical protein
VQPASRRAISRDCDIIEGPHELIIRVRWISRVLGTILLSTIFPFFVFLIWVKDENPVYIVLVVLLSYPALLIGLNWYGLRVTPDVLRMTVGPIPFFGRSRSLAASDIREVSWRMTRTPIGRGGVAERFSLLVRTQQSPTPVTLLDAPRESDIRAVAVTLVEWLNARRSNAQGAIVLR